MIISIKKLPWISDKIIFFFFPIIFSVKIYHGQSAHFTISITLKNVANGEKIYLQHKYDDITYIDSAAFKNESVKFSGSTPEPNMYWLSWQKTSNPDLIFFVDKGKIKITGEKDNLSKAMVEAGKSQQQYLETQLLTNQFKSARSQMLSRFQTCNYQGDKVCAERILDSARLNEKKYIQDLLGFIKKNPESNLGGYLIFSAVFDWPEISDYDRLYDGLGEKVKKGKFGKLALTKINSIKGNTIGYPAIDFSQADENGKLISLSSFKGKYVLVDFWASWCGPCRRENPNVVNAYHKYKSKGFDILGVSFDDNKDKWLQAVSKDGLVWTQVSDLKGWQNEAGKLYGINSIPFNLLLDKEGKIIAKGLRGPDLEAKLAELLGE